MRRMLFPLAAALPAALTLTAAGQAPAQERLRLSAGEHGDYSRIVAPNPNAEWRLRETETGAELVIDTPELGVEAAQVVTQRRAHRVTSLETVQDGGSTVLRFGFNCDCAAVATRLPGGQIMIDISPRAAQAAGEPQKPADKADSGKTEAKQPEPKKAEAKTPKPKRKTAAAPETASDGGADDPVARARAALLESLRKAADEGLIAFQQPPEAPGEDAQAETKPETKVADKAPVDKKQGKGKPTGNASSQDKQAEDGKTEGEPAQQNTGGEKSAKAAPANETHSKNADGEDQYGDSAETGGEDVKQAPSQADDGKQETTGAEMTADPAETGEDLDPAAEAARRAIQAALSSQFAVSEGFSRSQPESVIAQEQAALEPKPDPAPCLPQKSLDPKRWRGKQSFFAELSRRRALIYNDVNLVDVDALASVGRLYLSEALGEEAAALPRIFRVQDDQEMRFLTHLSDVILAQPPKPDSPFGVDPYAEPEDACKGRHGIWRAAALAQSNPKAALAAYEAAKRALPSFIEPHRRLFGARIGRAAVAAGALETAEELLEILKRNSEPPTIDMLWMEAELYFARKKPLSARKALRMIASQRSEQAPRALMELAETFGPKDDVEAVTELQHALQDFALQYRNSRLAVALIKSEAELTARFGDLPNAIHKLEYERDRNPEIAEEINSHRVGLIEAEVAGAILDPSPERFSSAMGALALFDQDEALELRLALAQALLDNGAAAVVPLALPTPILEQSEAARILLAAAEADASLRPKRRERNPAALPKAQEAGEDQGAKSGEDQSTDDMSEGGGEMTAAEEPDPLAELEARTPPPITDKRPIRSSWRLLEALDEDVDLLKKIAREQTPPVPDEHAGSPDVEELEESAE